jgi:sulfate permease, SulP family
VPSARDQPTGARRPGGGGGAGSPRAGPRLLGSAAAGLTIGALEVAIVLSLAALIFSGPLSVHLEAGAGLALVSATVVMVVVSLRSSIPEALGSVQDSTAAVTALVAAGVAAGLPAAAEETFLTVVVALGLTTLATGLFLLLLGFLRLGALIRFVPYPVVGGFMAGTGLLLATGGLGVATGDDVSLRTLRVLLERDALARWSPAAAFALGLLVLARRRRHPLVVPGALAVAAAAFYGTALAAGAGRSELEDGGWLLGPLPGANLWEPWSIEGLTRADWGAIAAQTPNIVTVVLVATVGLLLNTSGIELAVDRDADLDRELRTAGGANALAGLAGGVVGFHALSLTSLARRTGGGRAVGLVAALVCALALVLGGSLIGLAPRAVVGGLLLFLGLAFLVEWLYDAWWRLPRADYAVVVLILAVIGAFGFLEGVAAGLVLTVVLFVVNYSRTEVVKHALSGAGYRSNVDRDPRQLRILRERGEELFVVELQGFLFFGTASSLLDRIRTRALDPERRPLSFLVLDFRRVSGLDSSAVQSFVRAHRLAQGQGFTIGLAGLSDGLRRQLERGGFSARELEGVLELPDLDRALQWWEDELLAREAAAAEGPRSLHALLAEHLGPGVDPERLVRYLEPLELAAGDELLRQGDTAGDVYLLESGRLTALLTRAGGGRVRLRTMTPGTVVGEVTLYLGTGRSAAVVAEDACRVHRLAPERLAAMERDEPELAAALHRALARLLAGRLVDSLRTLEALLD